MTSTRASGLNRRTAGSAAADLTRYRSTFGWIHSRCGEASVQNTTWRMNGYLAATVLAAEAAAGLSDRTSSTG